MAISLKNKTALITGASSGFGLACAHKLAELGVNLIIAARREERLKALESDLKQRYGVQVLSIVLDVTNKQHVQNVLHDLKPPYSDIDIVLNNAGLALGRERMQEGNLDHWERMIATNISGMLYVTHTLLPNMVKRNQGHIVNIGSIAGHDCYPGGNIYSVTKHAVRAISKSLRIDLLGTGIRVSEIDPGAAETEFSEVRFNDKNLAKKVYEGFTPLVADDIADAIIYVLTRPAHVTISELVIYPQAQASVNHVARKSQE